MAARSPAPSRCQSWLDDNVATDRERQLLLILLHVEAVRQPIGDGPHYARRCLNHGFITKIGVQVHPSASGRQMLGAASVAVCGLTTKCTVTANPSRICPVGTSVMGLHQRAGIGVLLRSMDEWGGKYQRRHQRALASVRPPVGGAVDQRTVAPTIDLGRTALTARLDTVISTAVSLYI